MLSNTERRGAYRTDSTASSAARLADCMRRLVFSQQALAPEGFQLETATCQQPSYCNPSACTLCFDLDPADIKYQIATESTASNELMLELGTAQHDGPAAHQLVKLKQDLCDREEERINQQCT